MKRNGLGAEHHTFIVTLPFYQVLNYYYKFFLFVSTWDNSTNIQYYIEKVGLFVDIL